MVWRAFLPFPGFRKRRRVRRKRRPGNWAIPALPTMESICRAMRRRRRALLGSPPRKFSRRGAVGRASGSASHLTQGAIYTQKYFSAPSRALNALAAHEVVARRMSTMGYRPISAYFLGRVAANFSSAPVEAYWENARPLVARNFCWFLVCILYIPVA